MTQDLPEDTINPNNESEQDDTRRIFQTKATFCVEDYCKEVLAWFSPSQRQFSLVEILSNNPNWRYEKADVCRLFLSTLHLANNGKFVCSILFL